MEKIYAILVDKLTLSILQPIIVGCVIQFFIIRWSKMQEQNRLNNALLLILRETSIHSASLKKLIAIDLEHSFEYSTPKPLDIDAWEMSKNSLLTLPSGLVYSIHDYYAKIRVLNDTLAGCSTQKERNAQEAANSILPTCETLQTDLQAFLTSQQKKALFS